MPNLLFMFRRAVKRAIGYGRDLTPSSDQKLERDRIQKIAAEMRQAGMNTKAVQRAAEVERARD